MPLTPEGEQQARALAPAVQAHAFGLVLCSPSARATRTAELAGLSPEPEPDLVEWDYGDYEGITTAEIVQRTGRWDMWHEPPPGGESAAQVGARIDRVLERARRVLDDDQDVCLVAHGHSLRVVAARWLGLGPEHGAGFKLDTGTVCTLGEEHDRPVVLAWNVPARAWGRPDERVTRRRGRS